MDPRGSVALLRPPHLESCPHLVHALALQQHRLGGGDAAAARQAVVQAHFDGGGERRRQRHSARRDA